MKAGWYILLLVGVLVAKTLAGGAVVFEGPAPERAGEYGRMAQQPGVTADSLRNLLEADGYLDAEVRADSAGFVVRAGGLSMLRNLVVARGGDTAEAKIDRRFTRSLIQRLVDSLLTKEHRGGYYYASATIDNVIIYGEYIDIYMSLHPGPVVRVGEVRYVGLARVTPGVVQQWLPEIEGEVLSDEILLDHERAAGEIPFVRFQPPLQVRPRPGFTEADLELTFVEDRAVALEIGGGYVPDEDDNALLWHVDARFNNVFGGGRRAGVLSERREIDRQVLRIDYSQPVRVLGLGEARGEVATRDYRESFYEFAVTTGYDTRIRPGLTVGAELAYRAVDPSEGARSYAAYQAGFRARWERMDEPTNPRRGLEVTTSIAYAHRRYDADSTTQPLGLNETRTAVEGTFYQRIVGAIVLGTTVGYQGLETGEDLPPLSELVLVGGPGSIRGYRNEQFAVVRAAMFGVEPRVRFESGYLFAFLDGVYLNNRVPSETGVRTQEDFHTGFGLGIAVVAERRAVRLSLGWNPDLRYDEPRLSIQFSSEI